MTIHRPRLISSYQGLGMNTIKEMKYVNNDLAIGTEIWGEVEKPWAEGDTIIAKSGYKWRTRWEAGKPYIITKFFNDSGDLIAIYCDISRPVRRVSNGFEFDDMYLDVWQIAGQRPVILDEDELEEAFKAGYISQEEVNEVKENAAVVCGLLNRSAIDLTSL